MRVIRRCFALLLCATAALLATDDVGTATAAVTTTAPTTAATTTTALTPVDSASGSSPVPASAGPSTSQTPVANVASPVPIHSAQVNSDTFRVTDNLVCPDIVSTRINAVYTKNKKMFMTCMEKSGYQIFPYSGKVPTAQDITLMVQTPQCMAVITAVALSDLPACSIGDMPVKAVVETLLKIAIDMADGAIAPSASEFHALMAWRRDVNAAQAAGVPYDSDSELYARFKKALWRVMSSTTVKVLSDLTIVYAGSTSASASGDPVVATVKPSDATSSSNASSTASTKSVAAAPTPSPSSTSSSKRPAATAASTLLFAALVAWTV